MIFQRPIGAALDFKELEYIVALHQSSHEDLAAYQDGSIDHDDVRIFLMSRYGIGVTNKQVRDVIFHGLAGGDGEDEFFDIIELVAVLIIPMLVKLSKNNVRSSTMTKDQKRLLPPAKVIQDVLHDIITDTTKAAASLEEPPTLTPKLLKKILIQSNEIELAQDDALISDMIALVSGDEDEAPLLDVETFTRALTNDVKLYNPDNENSHSTILMDVFPEGIHTSVKEDDAKKEASAQDSEKKSGPAKIKFSDNLTMIDFTADTARFSLHVISMWLIIVFSYFFYMADSMNMPICKVENLMTTKGFSCSVLNAFVTWFEVMTKLIFFMGAIGVCLSFGNGAFGKSTVGPTLGLLAVTIFVLVPPFWPDDDTNDVGSIAYYLNTYFFDTTVDEDIFFRDKLWPILLVFGFLLAMIHIRNLIDLLHPDKKKLLENKLLRSFDSMLGSNRLRAFHSKQAGIFKVNEMVRHAYDLHHVSRIDRQKSLLLRRSASMYEDSKKRKSSKETALQNYSDLMDETEEVGGIFWGWKEFLSNRLAQTEGVWIPSRLLAGTTILFITFVIVSVMIFVVFNTEIESFHQWILMTQDYGHCNSTFDIDKCYFPYEQIGGDPSDEANSIAPAPFYTGLAICKDVTLSPGCQEEHFGDSLNAESTLYKENCKLMDEGIKVIGNAYNTDECVDIFKDVSEAIIKKFKGWIKGDTKIFSEVKWSDELEQDILDGYSLCWKFQGYNAKQIEDFNKETGENITADDVQFCGNYTGLVDDEFLKKEAGLRDTFKEGWADCMNAYGGLRPSSMCDREFYRVFKNVATYERGREGSQFCRTFLSVCSPDPVNPLTATCVIGEKEFVPYKFEGPTCNDYISIDDMMRYYDKEIAPKFKKAGEFIPELYMLQWSAYTGIVVGMVAAFSTAFVYIPSSIHTILKFRSGVIPSLKSRHFLKYRKSLHQQSYLIGTMFWGLFASALIFSILTSLVVFVCLWQFTREVVITGASIGIGAGTTIGLKIFISDIIEYFTQKGFYRTKPWTSNAVGFAMECWNLALTSLFVVSRVAKALILVVLYVGRMDKPFLATDLIFDADLLPIYYNKNLLSTEAHRHPYIELLGLIYLMKLRYQDDFGTRAGSTWRLVFVIALMPWLRAKRMRDDISFSDVNDGNIPKAFAEVLESPDGEISDEEN